MMTETQPETQTKDIIRTVSDDQEQIILDILKLHVPSGVIDVDPTYSKGVFYKNGFVPDPPHKFDLYPQTDDTIEASADNLPMHGESVSCVMFDPPFVISGKTWEESKDDSCATTKRFGCFYSIQDLWRFYHNSLEEFHRILQKDGILIFKCQDTITSGKNYMSHCEIYSMASQMGFYAKDLFILTAKNRMNSFGGRWKTQQHARKYHSYFWVFQKR